MLVKPVRFNDLNTLVETMFIGAAPETKTKLSAFVSVNPVDVSIVFPLFAVKFTVGVPV